MSFPRHYCLLLYLPVWSSWGVEYAGDTRASQPAPEAEPASELVSQLGLAGAAPFPTASWLTHPPAPHASLRLRLWLHNWSISARWATSAYVTVFYRSPAQTTLYVIHTLLKAQTQSDEDKQKLWIKAFSTNCHGCCVNRTIVRFCWPSMTAENKADNGLVSIWPQLDLSVATDHNILLQRFWREH